MAEVKNSFVKSKMNKDLDDRLLPNGEYRDALNVSINKSQGDGTSEGNVGTLQTVLGNERIINFSKQIQEQPSNVEVIGILPSDDTNTIYAFLTNNTIKPYVPKGAVGVSDSYPNGQNSADTAASINAGGTGYSDDTGVGTINFNSSGSGLEVDITTTAGVVTGVTISDVGTGYNEGDILIIDDGDENATILLTSVYGPISITDGGTGYNTTPATGETTGGSGSGLKVTVTESSGVIDFISIADFGGGYEVGDVITVSGGNDDATFTIDYILPSYSAIVSLNPQVNTSFKVIAQGPWLNFSTQAPIYGINILENLLFFTDNRNQPRKVNVDKEQGYYTSEDQISVAKYYPFESMQLYQPSLAEVELSQEQSTAVSNAVTDSKTITMSSTTGSAPVNLGVIGTHITNPPSPAGTGYSTDTNVSTIGGSGNGLTVDITAASGPITAISINKIGEGYVDGDVLTISGGNNDAQVTVSVIKPNTFVTDTTDWSTGTIEVNQNQTIPSGMDLYFVDPETTMQSADEPYLPGVANAIVSNGTHTTTAFNIDQDTYRGLPFTEIVGLTIYSESGGVYTSTGGVVTSATKSGAIIQIVCSSTGTALVADDNVRFARPNPYYDSDFATRANIEYLSDKFVRFSYRFKFDDGEYSLIAPFTQPCFIPEQDGYFLNQEFNNVDEGLLNDEENTYRSTEVSFMENKVNKILLNIPLPSAANKLASDFKITEIDIVYKESDKTALKIVETIPLTTNVIGEGNYYTYEYGSKSPFKTLPESEVTRVFDKVPVKALSQEVAGNRIIYGNYQDRHTPPDNLDYTLGATTKNDFFVSKNHVDSFTSLVEYPNATLKQNRDYEVGVVLSDKFGRQSTPIFSKQSVYSSLGPFLASAIYSPYRSDDENSPIGGIKDFDGNSLKIQFNDFIKSTKDETIGTPGLYNGDQTSSEYNPLGWYSFKIVVKQTEQEYYNAYIPSAMACYPLLADREKEIENTSHIILLNDNINKIPRDLTEVGPAQREFRSSVRMFGRVSSLEVNSQNEAFFPEKKADISTNVATIKDLFDYDQFETLVTGTSPGYLFYNFDYISDPTNASFPDSSSLVARINTQKKFGMQIEESGTYAGQYQNKPALNVYELAPVESLLDIYWETSTSGTIEDLNQAIEDGPAPNQFAFIQGGNWILTEGADPLSDATEEFLPVRLDGTSFSDPSANTCEVISVTSLGEPVDGNVDDPSIVYFDNSVPEGGPDGIFGIESGNTAGSFKIVLRKPGSGTADSNGTSTGTTLNIDNVSGDILADSVVTGDGIPAGTKVVSYSAPTVTFNQNVNVTAVNIPLAFGADAPGLVFRNENLPGNEGVNNYSFLLRFNNPEAGAPVDLIYQAQARLQNEPPLGLTVISLDKTNPISLCDSTPLDPTSAIINPIVLGQVGAPIANITAFNGSSTTNLKKEDLTFAITGMRKNEGYATQSNDWEDIPSNVWSSYFIIDDVVDDAFGGDTADKQLFAEALVEEMVEYQVTIQAFDGEGITSNAATCYATFVIREDGFVTWGDQDYQLGPGAACPAGTGVGDSTILTMNNTAILPPEIEENPITFTINNVEMRGTWTLTLDLDGYTGDVAATANLNFTNLPPGQPLIQTLGVDEGNLTDSVTIPTTGSFDINFTTSIQVNVSFLNTIQDAPLGTTVQATLTQSFCDVSL